MKRTLSLILAALLLAGGVYADDFAFDDFGSDDFSFDDFGFGDFGGSGDTSGAVSVSGVVSADARAYVTGDEDSSADYADCAVAGGFDADLTVSYSGRNADAVVVFNLNKDTLSDNLSGLVDEAYGTLYDGNFKLEAGKMKTVWGKGDKLHVIDNFNADDYTDFIIPDYLERRIATPMVKATYAFDFAGNVLSNVKIEGVYTPFLPVDRFATEGVWTPAQVSALTETVTGAAEAKLAVVVENLEHARLAAAEAATLKELAAAGNVQAGALLTQSVMAAMASGAITTADVAQIMQSQGIADQVAAAGLAYEAYLKNMLTQADTAYLLALNGATSLSGNPDTIYPDTASLKYGQAGARLTGSLGPVDLGLSYYYGHYKQPSVNAAKIDGYLTKQLSGASLTDDDAFLAYDQKQTFGVEAATILWHFNLRGEACYNLTEDTDGDDPWVHNNSVQWLGGFDIDLPFWNMNVNVQETGTYVLNSDAIEGSATELMDVDYCANGYMNNKIAANITTSFKNEKICPEATVMYGVENGDLVVMPKLAFNPASDVTLTVSGMYDWCKNEDSEFYGWDKNNFVQLGMKVSF